MVRLVGHVVRSRKLGTVCQLLDEGKVSNGRAFSHCKAKFFYATILITDKFNCTVPVMMLALYCPCCRYLIGKVMTCLWKNQANNKILNKTLESLMKIELGFIIHQSRNNYRSLKNKQSIMNIINRIMAIQIKFNKLNLIKFKSIS